MDCEKAREAISSAIDGEPLGVDASGLDSHVETCPACRQYALQLATLDERLRKIPAVGVSADESDSRWARVSLALDAHDLKHARADERRSQLQVTGRRRVMFAGLSAAAVAIVAGVGIRLTVSNEENAVAAEAVNDFLTFRANGKTLHVMNAEPADVKQWLAARVSFEIPIDPTPPAGFKLAGGRLCSFLERRLVFFYYQRQEHAVSVYLMNEDGLSLPDGHRQQLAGKEVSVASLNGVTHVMFRRDGLIYVVVSDLQAPEVLDFAADI